MKKLNEMFSAMKTTVLSMDKKNKTILGIVAVALVAQSHSVVINYLQSVRLLTAM